MILYSDCLYLPIDDCTSVSVESSKESDSVTEVPSNEYAIDESSGELYHTQ